MIPNKNLPHIQLSSDNASLKLTAEGNAVISVTLLAGGFFAGGLVAVPHNAGTDNVIWQVATFSDTITTGNNVPTPFESNDDTTLIHSYVDSTNLYIEVAQQDSGGSITPYFMTCYYRVALP